MRKAFEELEKSVTKLLEREESRKKTVAAPGGNAHGSSGPWAGPDKEEAVELIRRAIKRLKAL